MRFEDGGSQDSSTEKRKERLCWRKMIKTVGRVGKNKIRRL